MSFACHFFSISVPPETCHKDAKTVVSTRISPSADDDLVDGSRDGRALVLHEEDDELRRSRRAGVLTDEVYVSRCFIETLSGCKRHLLSTFYLHHHRAFHDIDEDVGIVPMYRAGSAG